MWDGQENDSGPLQEATWYTWAPGSLACSTGPVIPRSNQGPRQPLESVQGKVGNGASPCKGSVAWRS